MDALFEQAERDNRPKSLSDTVVENIEEEFRNPNNPIAEREKDKAHLEARLAELTKKLKQTGNVKNHRAVVANAQRSQMRKVLREKIEEVKDGLEKIKMEEDGEKITAEKLMAANKTKQTEQDKQLQEDIAFNSGNILKEDPLLDAYYDKFYKEEQK
jgi:hypothetical protein